MAKGEKKEKKKKSKKDKEKDEDGPRKPWTAFFFYMDERRPEVRKIKPHASNKEIIQEMTDEWRDMNDDEKQPYVDKMWADKKRYAEEKKIYDAKKAKENKEKEEKAEEEVNAK